MDYLGLLEQWAAVQPERPFLITAKASYTYQEILERAKDYARTLAAFQPEHRPLLILRKTALEQLICFLGAEKAGCVPVLAHPDLKPAAAREFMVRRNIPYGDLLGEKVQFAPQGDPQPEPVCMGVLSSGSTGLPKLMFRRYASWAGFFTEQNKKFQVTGNTVGFTEGSMSFTGNLSVWASLLYAGASLVLSDTLYSRTWLREIGQFQVTLLYLVPVKLKLLLRAAQGQYPSVTAIMAGSQLLAPETADQLKTHFPHSQIYLYYGASELNYITWLTYEELQQHPLSVGRPCPGVKVSVLDGKIYVDTPYHVEGVTCPFTLEDRGYFDADGYLTFLGRDGRVINKGGLTLSCTHVEQAILSVAGVADAVVLPVEEAARGENLGACVILQDLTLGQLRKKLKDLLLPGEIPGYWLELDALPLTGAGKVDSRKLSQKLQALVQNSRKSL